jgi:hypothetical protein
VSLLFVLFHDGSRRNFFGAAPISATFLRTFFDVFVLTLLFVADATQMVISRHIDPPVGIQQATYQAALSLPVRYRAGRVNGCSGPYLDAVAYH